MRVLKFNPSLTSNITQFGSFHPFQHAILSCIFKIILGLFQFSSKFVLAAAHSFILPLWPNPRTNPAIWLPKGKFHGLSPSAVCKMIDFFSTSNRLHDVIDAETRENHRAILYALHHPNVPHFFHFSKRQQAALEGKRNHASSSLYSAHSYNLQKRLQHVDSSF